MATRRSDVPADQPLLTVLPATLARSCDLRLCESAAQIAMLDAWSPP